MARRAPILIGLTLAAALLGGPARAADEVDRPERAVCRATADVACLWALGFTPGDYFERHADANWVSAVWYGGHGGPPAFAFAIAYGCPDRRGADCRKSGQERLMIRVVSQKADGPDYMLPSSDWFRKMKPAAAARAVLDWREADLAACPAALTVLDRLRMIDPRPIADWEWRKLQGQPPPGPMPVHVNGTWVKVTQTGEAGTLATGDHGEPGTAGAWAMDMLNAAEPCLKPSKATPPWDLG